MVVPGMPMSGLTGSLGSSKLIQRSVASAAVQRTHETSEINATTASTIRAEARSMEGTYLSPGVRFGKEQGREREQLSNTSAGSVGGQGQLVHPCTRPKRTRRPQNVASWQELQRGK
mmetsp:Transcript_15195/g.32605  ORF Transcript_15195/g.32605 Transcript_15195/m.32605 type:complete len:117 (+) Transcript_15195:647-997(+)